MKLNEVTAMFSTAGIWIQFVVASSVVYLDPGDNTFPYTKIVLTWPGVLEEIHRLWALVILIGIIANLVVVVRMRNRPSFLLALSVVMVALFVLQAMYGAITIWNYDYPPYVVLHEGNAGVLLFVSALVYARAALPAGTAGTSQAR